jgi:hypothetical protein
MPTQPRTTYQTNIRAILAGCSINWATLTAAEQMAWAAWADLHPRLDSLGQVVTLTGAQSFNAVNCLLVMAGLDAITTPPPDPLPDPPVITAFSGTDDGEFVIEYTPSPPGTETVLLLYMSPPKSLGTLFNGDYRYMGKKTAAQASPDNTVVTAEALAKFGLSVVGQRYFLRSRLLRADGGFSPWSGTAHMDVEPA